jgi:hypothetical protein
MVHPTTTIAGVVVQYDTPDWAPLEAAIGSEIADWFMWMFEIRLADGSHLHGYKHQTTRRYLHLTTDGRAFDYRAERYGEVGLASSIARTFIGWERADPSPRHLRALRAAVESARVRAE